MHLWLLVAGIVLILAALVDVFASTLVTTGAGPLTGRLMHALWAGMLAVHRRVSAHALLQGVGVAILLIVLAVWILLVWAGWTLVFCSHPGAVVVAKTGAPADWIARVYYTGYTITTLGMGDYHPGTQWAEIATALAGLNGIFLITLSITYLVPIVSAVTGKRMLALTIRGIGETPTGILLGAWDGAGFGSLEDLLQPMPSVIIRHGQQHLVYPILHYYHSTASAASAAVRIAALDEAITLLEHGVAAQCRPSSAIISNVRAAITTYIDTLSSLYIPQASEVPPPPPLDLLRREGVPVVDHASFEQALVQLAGRRKLLLASVRWSGWDWDAVSRTTPHKAW